MGLDTVARGGHRGRVEVQLRTQPHNRALGDELGEHLASDSHIDAGLFGQRGDAHGRKSLRGEKRPQSLARRRLLGQSGDRGLGMAHCTGIERSGACLDRECEQCIEYLGIEPTIDAIAQRSRSDSRRLGTLLMEGEQLRLDPVEQSLLGLRRDEVRVAPDLEALELGAIELVGHL